jgi:acyl phosphate:glycerol-3-phosphate acyltransferase
MSLLVPAIFGYLLGSIPFGLVITKLAGLGDIRGIGSGNIGATNVLRTGRRELAAATLLLDGGKGAAAVFLAALFFPGAQAVAGLAALLGHLFPIWLGGKGGKGVATAIGVLLALSWSVGITVMAVWLIVAFISRYSSLAALISIGLSPFYTILLGRTDLLWLDIVILLLIFFTHRANIRRLIDGNETKIGESEKFVPPYVEEKL